MLNLPTSTVNHQPLPRQLPPTVGKWPLLGAAPELARQQLQFLLDARERYGDIYTLRVGQFKIVALNHPDHAQHTLRTNVENYSRGGKLWTRMRTILGNGILLSEGPLWLRQRRMIQPQFHRQRITKLADTMIAAIDEVLNQSSHGDGRSVELTEYFLQIASNVILKTMFGSLVSPAQLHQLLAALNAGARYVGVNLSTALTPAWLQWTNDQHAAQIRQNIDDILYAMIAQSRAAAQAGHGDGHLISMLLDVVDDETGEPMTNEQLRDEIASIMFAGIETAAVTSAWALYFLMQHPAVLERMRQEADTVLGGRVPTFDDLAALSYTKQVVQETLRLRPAGSMLTRTSVADDLIDGYHIPANSMIILPLQIIHRHPDAWEQPNVFDPERFAARTTQRHPFAWIPFGAGQRMCIGRDFAMMEIQLALAMFLQRFAFTPKPGLATDPAAVIRLRPRGAIEAYLMRREHAT